MSGIPARVVQRLDGEQAVVELGGVKKTVSLALVPEARPGDYVIVHVGHALGLVDRRRPSDAGAVCRDRCGAMKYIDEFRNGDLARHIAARIAAEVQSARRYSFMEFCGGHTHAISRYGIAELLPRRCG